MKIKHTGVALGLLLLLVFVYWPGILGESAMKWDATAIYLPWKLFLCRSVFSGSLPFWNPFTSGGFPQCIDPGTWYPISYLFGWGGVYDLQSLLYEYLFHVWLAALGFYFILIKLSIDWRIAAIISSVFLFNGFFVGNAQHIGWVVAATWSIWTIYFFIGWLKIAIQSSRTAVDLRYGLGLGFTMYLLFTGGYPGMFVIQFYVLLVWSLIYWLHRKLRSDFSWKSFRNWLTQILVAVLVFITISIPAWISIIKYLPSLSRGNGLEAGELMFGSFPLLKSLDFLLPQTVISLFNQSIPSNNSWDISMIDGYWGVVLCWFLVVFLIMSKQRNTALPWVVAGLVCWLLAMGEDLPFKNGLNKVLPGMEYFRFPAQFRFWGILFWLIATAKALTVFKENSPKWLVYIGGIFIISEAVWHGFNQRYITVLAGSEEYVDSSVIKKVNAKLGELNRSSIFQKQLDTVTVRSIDGPKVEPFGFLWYNKGILLNRFAEDGYNPYSFKKYEEVGEFLVGNELRTDGVADSTGRETIFSDEKIVMPISKPKDLRRLVNVLGSNWELKHCELIDNNTIDIDLCRVDNRDTISSSLIINQTGVSGWNLSRSNSSEIQFDSSVFVNQKNRVPTRLIIDLDGGFSAKNYRLRLSFNPVFCLFGYCVSLSTLFWFSICFIVFWISISVYLNVRIWYGRFK